MNDLYTLRKLIRKLSADDVAIVTAYVNRLLKAKQEVHDWNQYVTEVHNRAKLATLPVRMEIE